MLDFLNNNAGALTVIFTFAVALSTVVYAILTASLVSETKKMREAQTEPKVEIVLKPREEFIHFVNLYVRNIGLGPAYDISFSILIESGGEGAKSLVEDFTKANFFRQGLRYLGPNQEMISGYSQMTDKLNEKIESVLNFKVNYKSSIGKTYNESFRIDFSELKGQVRLGRPHLYAIAQHLGEIQKDINKLTTGFARIKADIYDEKDREKEEKELEERYSKLIGENSAEREWWNAPKK